MIKVTESTQGSENYNFNIGKYFKPSDDLSQQGEVLPLIDGKYKPLVYEEDFLMVTLYGGSSAGMVEVIVDRISEDDTEYGTGGKSIPVAKALKFFNEFIARYEDNPEDDELIETLTFTDFLKEI